MTTEPSPATTRSSALTDWRGQLAARISDADRVAAAKATGLMDTEPEEAFDRLTRLAALVLAVPWTYLTLVDDQRSFWKSSTDRAPTPGSALRGSEAAVGDSFCQYVIAADQPVVVTDARVDPLTRANKALTSDGMIAWAGFPLRDAEGHVLGAMCAVDAQSRNWSASDLMLLETLAAAGTSEIQLRTALATATATASVLRDQLAIRDLIVARATLLADLARQLSAAGSTAAVAEIINTAGQLALASAFTSVGVLDDNQNSLRIVHSTSLPAEMTQRYATVPLTDNTPLGRAVAHRVPILLPGLQDLEEQFPHLVDDTLAAGLQSTASFPLFRSDGTIAGALGVGWAEPMEFTPIIHSLLTTVSQMCAQALDRTLLGDARNQFVRSLQMALLPSLSERRGLAIAAKYLPANNELGFGGDWYDIIPLTPERTALIMGDVCGHGIEAAATMTQIRGAVNTLVRLHSDRLDTVFDDVEAVLARPDPDFIATISVHVIDTSTNTVSYVSAGHPPAILVDSSGEWSLLEAGRRPVLGIGGPRPEVGVVRFAPDMLLLGYTDGLVEHEHRDLDRGFEAVARVLQAERTADVESIAESLSAKVAHANDDIAIAVLRRTG